MKRYRLLFCIIPLLIASRADLQSAGYQGSAEGQRKFYSELRRHKAAVVLFYRQEACGKRRFKNDPLRCLQRNLNMLARSGFYPKRAVRFMEANLKNPAIQTVARDNQIATDHLPALVLFSDGMPLKDQHGVVTLTGAQDRDEIKQFIDSYLNIDIAEYIKKDRSIAYHEKIANERSYIYYRSHFNPISNPWNGYWGWPYYGMAMGHYGGGVGINFIGSNY